MNQILDSKFVYIVGQKVDEGQSSVKTAACTCLDQSKPVSPRLAQLTAILNPKHLIITVFCNEDDEFGIHGEKDVVRANDILK